MIPLLLLSLAAPAQGDLQRIDLLTGAQEEQRFGATFSDLGDVNQDGISDFAVGSPGYVSPNWAWGGGKVEVFSGADRSLLYTIKADPGVDSLLGLTLNTLGDINQDGANELLVGAGGFAAAYIVNGANGQRISEVITNSNGQVDMATAVIGDVNQDGLPEFVLGLPFENAFNLSLAGKVMMFDGATGALIQEIIGGQTGRNLGSQVCGPGDLNGDGIPDVLINGSDGADFLTDGFTAYDGTNFQPIFTKSRRALRLNVLSMDAFQDFNGDGTPDFLLSGFRENFDNSWFQGHLQIISGSDGSTLHQIHGFQFEEFGRNATALGDFDGDHIPDFAAMELRLLRTWHSTPTIRIFSGATGDEITRIQGPIASFFRVQISGVADLNGDGRAEIVIGVSEDQIGGGTPGFNAGGELHILGSQD